MACSSPDSKSARVRVRPPGVGTSTGLAVGRTESTEVQKGGGKRKEPGLKADVDRPFGQHRRARTLRPFVRSSVRSFARPSFRSFVRSLGGPGSPSSVWTDGRTDGRTRTSASARCDDRHWSSPQRANRAMWQRPARVRERESHMDGGWSVCPHLGLERLDSLRRGSWRRPVAAASALRSPLSALRSPQPQRPPGVASVPGLAPLLAETRRRLDVCI